MLVSCPAPVATAADFLTVDKLDSPVGNVNLIECSEAHVAQMLKYRIKEAERRDLEEGTTGS